MRKLLILGAALMVFGAGFANAEPGAAGQITVTGEARVALVPDMASLQLGVSSTGKTASAAMAANTAAMQGVFARLQQAGIAARDLQTSNLNLSPNWVHSEGAAPQIKGYSAYNMVTVRVRDLAILGGVLDAAIADGANQLDSLTFAHSDPKPATDAARIEAVKDARARAEAMTGAAGARLGRIVSISESGGGDAPRPMMRMAADSAEMPISAGEIDTVARVTITFEIQE